MPLTVDTHFELLNPEGCDLLVLPFWDGGSEAADLSLWKDQLARVMLDFKGKASETLLFYGPSFRILLLGLGFKESLTPETLRRAYSAAVRAAQGKQIRSMHVVFPSTIRSPRVDTLGAMAEGIFLTNYAFSHLKVDSLKDNPVMLLDKVVFLGVEEQERDLLARKQTVASGVYLIRELVNGNADDVTPQMLAETALQLERRSSRRLKATVLDRKAIEKERMGLLLAVSRGASVDPTLIQLSYQGNPRSQDHIVFIGKGITYDTGGLSLKPTDGMLAMKCDMAGAATVLVAVHIASELGLPVNVTALVPSSENSIDAKSYKLGDVYRSMSGKTVEINNTDAEGRLVLADAITYALRYLNPTLIVDAATLTGGIIVALGEDIAGIFSNSEDLCTQLLRSSQATGEPLWRLPLYPEYKEMLKSDIADIVNSGGRPASSMTAALFLQEFVGAVPWAHLDIAGAAFLTRPKYYNTSKATGFGLRLLIDFLERR